jgi:hypothetical protein
VSVLLAATVLFSLADPRGDALGDGLYRLPARVEAGTVDLRGFSVIDNAGKLQFRLGMDKITNPADAPNGFSAPVFNIFLSDRLPNGGDTLGKTGFRTPVRSSWRHFLEITGWSTKITSYPVPSQPGSVQEVIDNTFGTNFAQNGTTFTPVTPPPPSPSPPSPPSPTPTGPTSRTTGLKVRVEGTDIIIDSDLPSQDYEYWGFVLLRDSFSGDTLAQPRANPSFEQLGSGLDNPPLALDVLSEDPQYLFYEPDRREVPALGYVPPPSDYLLISALIGGCLALGATL